MIDLSLPHIPGELRAVFADRSLFSSLDIHFANFMARLAATDSPAVPLAAALVSSSTSQGNICLDLAEYAGRVLAAKPHDETSVQYVCPVLEDWLEHLLESGVVGEGDGNTPLVLDGNTRLYLHRYWEYEKTVADFILMRAGSVLPDLDYSRLVRDVQKLFKPSEKGGTDWQKIGAVTAAMHPFSVISGGPGTGKTYIVARILALLLGQYENKAQPLRIVLAAPTGKAAARLQESIASTDLLRDMVDLPQAATLHRILGSIPNSPYFRHDAENKIAADVIIVDEASMVDLPLMAKLLQAVPGPARLILIGDRYQLASVQPGSVFGDICHPEAMRYFTDSFFNKTLDFREGKHAATKHRIKAGAPGLQDSFVELENNYRFSDESGIAGLSKAVRDGDGDRALDLLLAGTNGQISWSDIPDWQGLISKLLDWQGLQQYAPMMQTLDPETCFEALDRFRILCGLRNGPYGVQKVNRVLESQFKEGRLPHSSGEVHTPHGQGREFFAGQPVMIARNDYNLQLFNGDVGIILPDPDKKNSLRACFKDVTGNIRNIALPLLPPHETVFAMTVHKSQGSEFSRVLLILPDQDSAVLTRELLYTAITRARESIEIWGRKDIFVSAVKRRLKRSSGLAEALWGE